MSLLKSSRKDLLIYGIGSIFSRGIGYIMLPFYTHYFSMVQYGLIVFILAILPVTRFIIPADISQASTIFCVDEPDKRDIFLSTGLIFTAISTVLFCILAISIVWLFQVLKPDNFVFLQLSDCIYIAIYLILDSIFYYSTTCMRWDLKSKAYNIILNSNALLEAILVVITTLLFKTDLTYVWISWAVAKLIVVSMILISSYKDLSISMFSTVELKRMLKFSIPLAINNIPNNLNDMIDRFLVGKFLGAGVLGIYGAAYVFSSMVNFVITICGNALTPLIYHHKNNENAAKEVGELFSISQFVMIFFILFFALFKKEILSIFLSESFYTNLINNPLVLILMFSAFFAGINLFFPGIFISRKTKFLVLINSLCVSVNIILISLALYFKLGLLAIGFSVMLANLLKFFLVFTFSQKYFYMPFKIKDVIRSLLIYGAILVLFVHVNSLLNNGVIIDLAVKVALYFIIFVLCGFYLYKDKIILGIYQKRQSKT